jgi:hypothetical protein
MRNYLVAMGFRIVGFPVSVWLLLHDFVVLGAALAVCATVMPSIAVVIANAVDRRGTSTQDATPVSPVQGLGPSPHPAEEDAPPTGRAPTAGDQIPGTVVASHETPYPRRAEEAPGDGAAGPDDRREAS